jgi:hypothetical protein
VYSEARFSSETEVDEEVDDEDDEDEDEDAEAVRRETAAQRC